MPANDTNTACKSRNQSDPGLVNPNDSQLIRWKTLQKQTNKRKAEYLQKGKIVLHSGHFQSTGTKEIPNDADDDSWKIVEANAQSKCELEHYSSFASVDR